MFSIPFAIQFQHTTDYIDINDDLGVVNAIQILVHINTIHIAN